jgi:hypothetical protein
VSGFGYFLQVFEHILDCEGYSVVAFLAVVSFCVCGMKPVENNVGDNESP